MFLRTNEKMKRYNYLPQVMKIKMHYQQASILNWSYHRSSRNFWHFSYILTFRYYSFCANRNVLAPLLLQSDEECHLLYSSRPQNVESWAIPSWKITIDYSYHHSVQLLSYSLHLSYSVNNR
jgi:hypothetical protein